MTTRLTDEQIASLADEPCECKGGCCPCCTLVPVLAAEVLASRSAPARQDMKRVEELVDALAHSAVACGNWAAPDGASARYQAARTALLDAIRGSDASDLCGALREAVEWIESETDAARACSLRPEESMRRREAFIARLRALASAPPREPQP